MCLRLQKYSRLQFPLHTDFYYTDKPNYRFLLTTGWALFPKILFGHVEERQIQPTNEAIALSFYETQRGLSMTFSLHQTYRDSKNQWKPFGINKVKFFIVFTHPILGAQGSSRERKGAQGSSRELKGAQGSSRELKVAQGSSREKQGEIGSYRELKGTQGN